MSVLGDIEKMGESIWGNVSGDKPTDALGYISHYLQNVGSTGSDPNLTGGPVGDVSPTTGKDIPTNPPKEKDTFKLPTESGAIPTEYNLTDPSAIKEPGPYEETLSDTDFSKLESEAANGNKLAEELIKAYKPDWQNPYSFEKSLVQPYVSAIQDLPAEESQISAEGQAAIPPASSDISQAQQIAQSVSGVAPQSPDPLTQSLGSLYSQTTAAAIAQSNAVEQQSLTDLGKAAKLSQESFPYTSYIQDLLNRYAYQIESPSYTTAPVELGQLPASIQALFQGAGVSSSLTGNPLTALGGATLPTDTPLPAPAGTGGTGVGGAGTGL
jgi:hypothetical protein